MSETISALKNGNKVLVEKQPHLILETEFVNPGKGQAFTRIKIKNLINNKILERTIKIGESLSAADVTSTNMQFLYTENKKFFFMDLQTFEQFEIGETVINNNAKWLQEGQECEVLTWNSKIIQVEPPKFVNLKVIETESTSKGDTVSTTLKDALLENKISIKVPIFIKMGETIKIDTNNGEYISRAKSKND